MSKGPWESRVGMLLKQTEHFNRAIKVPDSALYGGQPRIDWIACDKAGRHWEVEVKQLPEDRQSINLRTEVSAGQREALTQVSRTTVGVALLAVGRGDTLYIFDWGRVLWQWRKHNDQNREHPEQMTALPSLLPLASAPLALKWTGQKAWETIRLLPLVEQFWDVGIDADIPQTLIVPERPLRRPASLRSTLRRKGSTPTPRRMLRLVQ